MDRCTTCHLAIDREGLREVPAAVQDAPEPVALPGQRLAASARPDRLHGLPRGHGAVGQLPRRLAHAARPRSRRDGVGGEVPLGRAAPVGLPDAAGRHDRSVVREVPQAGGVRPERREAERRPTRPTSAPAATPATRRAASRTCGSPGPILTKIESKLTPDWVKTWIRNPRAVKPTTWMPRVWYNSNSSSPEDAVRNEVEIDATVAYLFANTRRRTSSSVRTRRAATPSAASRSSSRSAASGCHVIDEKTRARGRSAADVRPAASEHRQQDDLRVALRLGARSEALQPRHLHARSAPDRRAGGRRRHVSDDAEGAGGRCRQGDARSGGRRRGAARLLPRR